MKFVGHKMKLRRRAHKNRAGIYRKSDMTLFIDALKSDRNHKAALNPRIVVFRETKVLPSACASVRDLAGGLSLNGGNIHVHPRIPFITIRPTIKRPISQSVPPASVEIKQMGQDALHKARKQ